MKTQNIFLVSALSLLLAACRIEDSRSGPAAPNSPHVANPDRPVPVRSDPTFGDYILYRSGGTLSESEIEALSGAVIPARLALAKVMGYRRGIVVTGSGSDVNNLAIQFGISAEKEIRFVKSTARSSPLPRPTASPEQPPQLIPSGVAQVHAQAVSSRGEGVVVCVVDTGIDLSHKDLKENIIDQFSTVTRKTSGQDDNGHGTHLAGIIAALDNDIGVVGVAPLAKLIAAKALDWRGYGTTSGTAGAIDHCVSRKVALNLPMVINMSWGSSESSEVLHEAIQRAHAAGIILIAAAGNEGATSVTYPAAYPEVNSTSSVNAQDVFSTFSNSGKVENAAPGENIHSTFLGSTYRTLSGTSMAAPHVAGVAALVLAAKPGAVDDDLLGVDIGLSTSQQGRRYRIDAVVSLPPGAQAPILPAVYLEMKNNGTAQYAADLGAQYLMNGLSAEALGCDGFETCRESLLALLANRTFLDFREVTFVLDVPHPEGSAVPSWRFERREGQHILAEKSEIYASALLPPSTGAYFADGGETFNQGAIWYALDNSAPPLGAAVAITALPGGVPICEGGVGETEDCFLGR